MVEVPDSTTRYIQSDSGKPNKDFFNWLKSVSDKINALVAAAGPGGPGVPACFSVYKNNQTGVAHATQTLVTWPNEIYNIGNYFASNAWTPTAGKIALCAGVIATADAGTAGSSALYFFKNGSMRNQFLSGPTGLGANGCQGAIEDQANGTDTYTVLALFTNSASTTSTILGGSVNTFFMGHWISP